MTALKSLDHFNVDDEWQREVRDRVLIPGFYMRYVDDRLFIPTADETPAGKFQQHKMAIDMTIVRDGKRLEIEEKIVRWPGYIYPTFFLETHHKNPPPGWSADGWMRYAQSDILLYAFMRPDTVGVYMIPFQRLRRWFERVEGDFKEHVLDNNKQSVGRLVPIDRMIKEMDLSMADIWTIRPDLGDPKVRELFPHAPKGGDYGKSSEERRNQRGADRQGVGR